MGKRSGLLNFICTVAVLMVMTCGSKSVAQQTSGSAAKTIGTVKTISGNSITLTSDAGAEISVQAQDTTRVLLVAPGQDLKEATPITVRDIRVGDRILVRGKAGDSEKSLTATTIIAMKKGDIAQKQQKELQDWQHRGIGGLVKATDPGANTVTVSTMTATGAKNVTVKLTPKTVIRRYSPDSVKFDDAKPGTLADIKSGDQLRARGDKNEDGTELTADEIVSGTFLNIAGLVTAVDAEKNTITVNDLSTKKPVTIRISGESQLHKLPQPIAQRIAMRLKGGTQEGAATNAPQNGPAAGQAMQHPGGAGGQGGPGEGGQRGGGDLGQMLNRMPAMPFSELVKGDAVMVVATSGSANTNATAISLLSGVEPILTASPNGSGAASMLAPWSIGSGGAEAAAAGPQ